MLASTFMDMVLGVDIHFEMVPMPAPVPTPLPDTEAAEMLGMQRLNTPGWSPAVNDAWVQGGIDAEKTFYLASEPGPANFFNPPGSAYPETVFKREMDQLEDAGYTRSGSCMTP